MSRCALAALLLLASCERAAPAQAPEPPALAAPAELAAPEGAEVPPGDGRLHLYFFDVGQGDSALVISPAGRTVLIDGGPAQAGSHLAHRLPALAPAGLDLIVLTHPRPDHLGGLPEVVRAVGARALMDSGQLQGEPSAAPLLEQLRAKGVPVVQPLVRTESPGAPARIRLGGGAELTVLWPRRPLEAPLASGDRTAQANSHVLKVTFGDTSALFMGDAQAETEEHLLAGRSLARATLLKVADHGGDRATTAAFLQAVRPKVAVLSLGAGNELGTPAKSILARLEQTRARVFRTDLDGEIHATSEGLAFSISTERPAAGEAPGTTHRFSAMDEAPPPPPPPPASSARKVHAAKTKRGAKKAKVEPAPDAPPASVAAAKGARYVASKNGEVFHLPGCRNARRITEKNLLVFRTRQQAAQKRRPAQDCNP